MFGVVFLMLKLASGRTALPCKSTASGHLSNIGLGNIKVLLQSLLLQPKSIQSFCTSVLCVSPLQQKCCTPSFRCKGLMKGALPFLWVFVFGLTHKFPLRTLLLPFPFCFLPATSLSDAMGFYLFIYLFIWVEVTEQYCSYMRRSKTTLLLGKEEYETVKENSI